MKASQIKRIELLEQTLKERTWYSIDCICFRADEPPFYAFTLELVMLDRLKCPLHGDRFDPLRFHIYVSKWVREKIPRLVERKSEQYRRAWYATFPPNLWPGVEEEADDGSIYLILKDGTRLLAELPPEWRSKKVQWNGSAETT